MTMLKAFAGVAVFVVAGSLLAQVWAGLPAVTILALGVWWLCTSQAEAVKHRPIPDRAPSQDKDDVPAVPESADPAGVDKTPTVPIDTTPADVEVAS